MIRDGYQIPAVGFEKINEMLEVEVVPTPFPTIGKL